MLQLDTIDLLLIDELQKNSKQSIKELAEKINLSITPTHERIKKIEGSGLIKKYVAIVNPELLGKQLIVYCQVTLVKHQDIYIKKFEQFVQSLDEVLEVSFLAGNYDYFLKIILKDINEYQNFIMHKLSKLSYITNVQSSFVIKQVKNETSISTKSL